MAKKNPTRFTFTRQQGETLWFYEYVNRYPALIIVAFFSALYFLTLYPDVGGRVNYGDSAKWQYLWIVDGTPHSTGYPLYLFLTKVFALSLSFIDYAHRITVISAVFAVLTLLTLYSISQRVIKDPYLRVLPALLLGTNWIFWSQATEAEVYTLNSFFVSLILYFLIKFIEGNSPKFLLIALAIYALSFGNHLTVITLLPAFLYVFFSSKNYKKLITFKNIFLVCLIFITGASQYLYLLYLSHHGSEYLEFIGKNSTFTHWIDYITGGQFRGQIGAGSFVEGFLIFLKETFKSSGILLAFIAGFLLLKLRFLNLTKPNRIVLLIFVSGVGQLIFSLSYSIGDILVYYIPVYLSLFLLVGIALDKCLPIGPNLRDILIFLLSLLFIIQVIVGYLKLTEDPNTRFKEIRSAFNELPANSQLVIPEDGFFYYAGRHALNYLRHVEFRHKNISFLSPYDFINSQSDSGYVLNSFAKGTDSKFFKTTQISRNLSKVTAINPSSSLAFSYNDKRLVFENWHNPEDGFRWAKGSSSTLSFDVDTIHDLQGELRLVIGTLGRQRIEVFLNGTPIVQGVYEGWFSLVYRDFDRALLTLGSNSLRFDTLDARSPGANDTRILGVALKEFRLD